MDVSVSVTINQSQLNSAVRTRISEWVKNLVENLKDVVEYLDVEIE